MAESLAVKYRPHTWEDVCAQESIIKILKQQIDTKTFKNTYLFAGSSGCGKTTTARIFADAINGGAGSPTEIDAASHNGVDNVRELIADASERSLDSNYKVMIIDECLTGETEVLTNKGYKRFDSLTQKEKIAQYNPDGSIEFVNPTEWIIRDYKGDMYNTTLPGGNKVLMSPHHVQPVYINDRKEKYIDEEYIKDIDFSRENSFIFTSGHSLGDIGKLSPIDRLAIVIAFIGKVAKETENTIKWDINLHHYPKLVEEVKEILQESGMKYNPWISSSVKRFWCEIPKELNITKNFSTYFSDISNRNSTYMINFIKEVMTFDGYYHARRIYYATNNLDNANFVAAIATLCGYCTDVKKVHMRYKGDKYLLTFHKKHMINTSNMRVEKVQFTGKIYCVKVPSHMIVVRVNGETFVTGNCHAITPQGWQAFLKCIEEPPEYTVFIFCTTDVQKVPETIKNRCQRFNFGKIKPDIIRDRLTYICQQEGFTNYEDGVDYLSKIADGGMRYAISLLDKCSSYSNEISMQNIQMSLGNFSYNLFFRLLEYILNKNEAGILKAIDYFYNEGTDMKLFINQFLNFILDVDKYIIFKSTDMTKIPMNYTNTLDNLCTKENIGKYITYYLDTLLDLTNMLKNDNSPKTTIEVMFLRMSRMIITGDI